MHSADGNHGKPQDNQTGGHQPPGPVAVCQPPGEGGAEAGRPDPAAGCQPDAGAGPVGVLQDVGLDSAQHHARDCRSHERSGSRQSKDQPAIVEGRVGTPVQQRGKRGRHRPPLYQTGPVSTTTAKHVRPSCVRPVESAAPAVGLSSPRTPRRMAVDADTDESPAGLAGRRPSGGSERTVACTGIPSKRMPGVLLAVGSVRFGGVHGSGADSIPAIKQ